MEGARTLESCSKPKTLRPIILDCSLRRMTVLITCCYFCSLFALCTGMGCTPVYNGPKIGYNTEDVNTTATDSNIATPTSVMVVDGINFTLKCTASRQQSFKWRLHDMDIVNDTSFRIIPPIAADRSGYYTTQLVVTNVTEKNAGTYKCVVSGCQDVSGIRSEDLNAGLTIKVIYAEKPVLKFRTTVARDDHTSEDEQLIVSAVVGKPASLSCITKSVAIITPKWRKETSPHSKLEMDKKCVVRNDNASLEEEDKWRNMDKKELKEAALFSPCFVFNVGLADGLRNLTLFFPILRVEDFGKYSCGIEGGPTTDAKVTLEVDILAVRKFKGGTKSLSVIEGEEALIYCNLTWPGPGRAGYQVIWTKDDLPYESDAMNNRTIDHSDNLTVITLLNVTLEDRGMYKCTIYNTDRLKVSSYQYQVRVRREGAYLLPLIIICVQLVIIFFIILIYEKTKGKAEVAGSNKDGSPDQKNEVTGMTEPQK